MAEKQLSSSRRPEMTEKQQSRLPEMTEKQLSRRPASRSSLSSIREQLAEETGSVKLTAQRDVLLTKLAETEFTNHGLRSDLLERDHVISDLRAQLNIQREELVASSSLHSSIETTRGHLRAQLRQREGDCNRLAVQVRTLENQIAQDRVEMHHIKGLLSAAKDKADRDKDALKKATRAQKQRAVRSEDALERVEGQLEGYKSLREDLEQARELCNQLRGENAQSGAEKSAMKVRLAELEHIMARFEGDTHARIENTAAQLHEKSSEVTNVMLDNDQLRLTLTAAEDKLHHCETEISQLRTQLSHYETLIEEYRGQLDKSRKEADETFTELAAAKKEVMRAQVTNDCEMEKVRGKMASRLKELDPLPEMLRTAELKLQDVKEQLVTSEKRNLENTKLISELTSKIEEQADQMSQTRRDRITMSDCSRILEEKVKQLDHKMHEMERQNADLAAAVAKKEDSIHRMNSGLDERMRENDTLSRQLEKALQDARRHAEQSRDLAENKDRAAHARILDLETQLTQSRAEMARTRREKEETEKKCNSRLYDLKDRLEQSHASNRSMQNYVQFLKNSYANVFGEGGSPARAGFK